MKSEQSRPLAPDAARRTALAAGSRLAVVLAGAGVAGLVRAQPAATNYPTKPVRVIVAFTAGGTTDILARAVCDRLGQKWGQPFVIDNKPGAGGNLGTEAAVRSAPDGYTLIVNSVGPMAVNPTLYKKLTYNPVTDLVPVIEFADVPNVLVVNPSLPVRNFEEFLVYAKAHPGELNYSSTGTGTSSSLSGFSLGRRAGLEITHVPYKGADALTDLIAGRVQFMFATIPSVVQQIAAGKLRAIAVSSGHRSRSMPDVPTVAEKGFPGFELGSWFGMFAPKGTPEPVIARLNSEINGILKLPEVEQRMIKEGADPVGGTPEQFGKFLRSEYERWKVLVLESGARVE